MKESVPIDGRGPTSLHTRKKPPHMLPPLDKLKAMNDIRMEMGSPIPRWRRPSLEEQQILEESPQEGRPMIRLTPCPTSTSTSSSSTSPSKALTATSSSSSGLSPSTPGIGSRYTPLEPIRTRGSPSAAKARNKN